MEAIILAAVLVMIVLLVICLVQMRALRNTEGTGAGDPGIQAGNAPLCAGQLQRNVGYSGNRTAAVGRSPG